MFATHRITSNQLMEHNYTNTNYNDASSMGRGYVTHMLSTLVTGQNNIRSTSRGPRFGIESGPG